MKSDVAKRIESINKGIIPEGYKKTKVGIVPVEWEISSLDKYIVEHNEKSTENNQYPVLTSSRKGIFLQSDYYNKQVASEDNTGYNIVPFGYFTYRHMSDDEIFRFNINNIVEKGIVSTLYPVFTTKNLNDNWLLNTLNYGTAFQKYALIQKQGGSRTYMYLEKLKKLRLAFPPLTEQKKIAEILSTQDKLIELQEKKIEQLKELKKAYLQKMFPKKGSKFPELRFKGFTDAWEQRKLSEISDIVTGTTPPTKDKENYGGNRLFVSPADIQGNRYIDKTTTTLTEKGFALGRELRDGTTLFVSIGSTIGKVAQIKDSATTNQQINAVIPNDDMSDDFVFTMLENEADKIKKLAATQAVPIINKTTFGETEISYPKKGEQQQIGSYFRNLDHLITLHQRKLDEEKLKKKALMQLLLTGKVRVKL